MSTPYTTVHPIPLPAAPTIAYQHHASRNLLYAAYSLFSHPPPPFEPRPPPLTGHTSASTCSNSCFESKTEDTEQVVTQQFYCCPCDSSSQHTLSLGEQSE